MEILKNLEVYEKAKRVIDSCVNEYHINAAEKYCVLYYQMFEDFVHYRLLLHRLYEKSENL